MQVVSTKTNFTGQHVTNWIIPSIAKEIIARHRRWVSMRRKLAQKNNLSCQQGHRALGKGSFSKNYKQGHLARNLGNSNDRGKTKYRKKMVAINVSETILINIRDKS